MDSEELLFCLERKLSVCVKQLTIFNVIFDSYSMVVATIEHIWLVRFCRCGWTSSAAGASEMTFRLLYWWDHGVIIKWDSCIYLDF